MYARSADIAQALRTDTSRQYVLPVLNKLIDILLQMDELAKVQVCLKGWDGKLESLSQYMLQPLRRLSNMMDDIEIYVLRRGKIVPSRWYERVCRFNPADGIEEHICENLTRLMNEVIE